MSKHLRRLLAALLAAMLVLAVFAGCSGGDKSSTSSSKPESSTPAQSQGDESSGGDEDYEFDYQRDTSPVTITDWFPSRWWGGVIDEGDGWETSPVHNHIQEMTGVDLRFEIPTATESEAIGPMIASGTYPDMVTIESYTDPYLSQMISSGIVYSITELSEKYAPKLLGENILSKSMQDFHTDDDGVLWYYVAFEGGDEAVQAYLDMDFVPVGEGNVMWVRSDILKAYGKEQLEGWEDFNSFLDYIRDNYDDVYPLAPAYDNDWVFSKYTTSSHFLSKFGFHLSYTYPNVGEKQIQYMLKDPAAKECYQWFNQLYQRGIFTDSLLVRTYDEMQDDLFAGKYGVVISGTSTIPSVNTALKQNGQEDKLYVPINQVLVSEEKGFSCEINAKSLGGTATVITKNCKNPDRAIMLLEYLLTEDGQVTGTLGVEGVSWKWDGNRRVLLPEASELIEADLEAYTIEYKVLASFTQFTTGGYWAKYCDDFLTPRGWQRDTTNSQLGPYVTDIWNCGFVKLRNTSFDSASDTGVLGANIDSAAKNGILKAIAAKSDGEFDAIYTALIDEINGMGVSTVEDAYTAKYIEYCDDLGITPFEKLYEHTPMSFEPTA